MFCCFEQLYKEKRIRETLLLYWKGFDGKNVIRKTKGSKEKTPIFLTKREKKWKTQNNQGKKEKTNLFFGWKIWS